jgi:hypothetical protein
MGTLKPPVRIGPTKQVEFVRTEPLKNWPTMQHKPKIRPKMAQAVL